MSNDNEDSERLSPRDEIETDWLKLEALGGRGTERYLNLRLYPSKELEVSTSIRKGNEQRGFLVDTYLQSSKGEEPEASGEFVIHGLPADAEVFRELAEAAERAAEYLENTS